jgi:hypothetical protein
VRARHLSDGARQRGERPYFPDGGLTDVRMAPARQYFRRNVPEQNNIQNKEQENIFQ